MDSQVGQVAPKLGTKLDSTSIYILYLFFFLWMITRHPNINMQYNVLNSTNFVIPKIFTIYILYYKFYILHFILYYIYYLYLHITKICVMNQLYKYWFRINVFFFPHSNIKKKKVHLIETHLYLKFSYLPLIQITNYDIIYSLIS